MIKLQLFQEVEFSIMRLKFNLFTRSNLFNNTDQEVNTSIIRSKPNKALLLISISWWFLWLTNWSWDWNSYPNKTQPCWSNDPSPYKGLHLLTLLPENLAFNIFWGVLKILQNYAQSYSNLISNSKIELFDVVFLKWFLPLNYSRPIPCTSSYPASG